MSLSEECFGKQPAVAGDELHAAGLCIPDVSLAAEADTLIKPYLEPLLLIVPSEAGSLTPYHTKTHMLDCVCASYPFRQDYKIPLKKENTQRFTFTQR